MGRSTIGQLTLLLMMLCCACSRVPVKLPDLPLPGELRQALRGVGRDIAQLGAGHPWAGQYIARQGDRELRVWCGPRGGLAWFETDGEKVFAYGTARVLESSEDSVHLESFARQLPASWEASLGSSLLVAEYKKQRWLLRRDRLIDFGSAVARREVPRSSGASGAFLLRQGDEERTLPGYYFGPGFGSKRDPDWTRQLKPLIPVRALVVEELTERRAIVAAGKQQGLYPDLELIPIVAHRQGAGRVVEAMEERSIIEFDQPSEKGGRQGWLLGRKPDDRWMYLRSWHLDPEVEERVARLDFALEQESPHEWAGCYRFGDGLYRAGRLWLHPEHGFALVCSSDISLVDAQIGAVEMKEGAIVLLGPPLNHDLSRGIAMRLRVVELKGCRFLLPEGALPALAKDLASGERDRRHAWLTLVQDGGYPRTLGEADLPPAWHAQAQRPEPQPRVLEVLPRPDSSGPRLVIDAGRGNGIHLGMRWSFEGSKWSEFGTVVVLREDRAQLEFPEETDLAPTTPGTLLLPFLRRW